MRSLPSCTLLLLALAAAQAPAQTPVAKPRPSILVIGTGGTIGSAGGYWTGNPTRVPIEQLVRVPGIDSVASVASEQLWNVASSAIGPTRWLELSRHVAELLRARPELAGIVVTHGTDTMEETAYFLDLTLPGDRPVIVTGAMRPSDMAGADGPANLTSAARAAVDPRARGRGAMVLMDDRLFAARDVTKTNSTRVETFQAPERAPVAIIDADGLFYRQPSPGRSAPLFDIAGVRELPRVDVVYGYAGADSVVIDALVGAGAKGLVMAGVGRGGLTPAQSAALRRARAAGVVVVVGTRTGSGRVPVMRDDGMVGAGDLNPQKARVLLMLGLSRTSDPREIARIFQTQQ
ncbi:MAG: asparaginase [Gemmatimonadaceae bacterium]|nr:asparaginase [Gemmatimonadaceae bacterium]